MGETLLRVTDVTYQDDNDLVVKVVGRTADGKRVVKSIYDSEPYLFVPESAPSPKSFDDNEATVVDVRGGFRSYDGVPLLQVVTEYPKGVRKLRKEYEKDERYESDVIYERRCTADYDLSGYIRVPDSASFDITDVESVSPEDVEEPIEPRVCYIDIEAEAPDEFYDDFAEEAPNVVQAITAYDSYDGEYILFCLDPEWEVDPGAIRNYIEDHWQGSGMAEGYADAPITFKRFGEEQALLTEFIRYIQEKRPDVATGWNYVDFDHEYLVSRIQKNDDLNAHALSDVDSVGGWQTERYVPGLPAVDMMAAMQKILYGQRESWSLEYIASDVLGIGKVSAEGNSYNENRSMFMAYNVVDTQLCVALDDSRGVLEFWYQLAGICSIPIYSVGSEMKEVEGVLFKHRTPNEILPETPEDRELDDISGGFVMPPSSGIREWVGVTDLKSLYPSSIITCNISRETMVDDPEEADIVVPNMPLNYEEVDGDEITEDDIAWTMDEGATGFTLDEEGIIPKYIKLLFEERRKKKQLRDQYEPGSSQYERYDLQQYAVKVIMNSFFGVSDNEWFRLSADGLGDAITSSSRFVQWYGVQQIESQGYDVIYGDSVPADEPTIVRIDGEVDILPIAALKKLEHQGDCSIEVWSEQGFTRVQEVIKKPNRKDMYLTRTKHGVVRTTEDHGLLTSDGKEVPPDDVSVGDELLHEDLANIEVSESADIGEELAWLYGFFTAEGSAGVYDSSYGMKHGWEICNQDVSDLKKCQRILCEQLGFDTVIRDVRESSNAYKLQPDGNERGEFKQKAELFDEMFYSGGLKKVPRCILNCSNTGIIEAFLDGYHDGDGYVGDQYDKRYHQMDTKSPTVAAGLVYLLRQTGREYNAVPSLDNRGREDLYYRVTAQEWHRSDPEEVERVQKIRYEGDHVYDLSTDCSHFHAGIGSMIVHNTDSLMLDLGQGDDDLATDQVIERGKELDDNLVELMSPISDEFGIPENHPYVDVDELPHDRLPSQENHLWQYEFEKLYRRFFQPGSKKRYAGNIVWKEGKRVDDTDTVGMEAERSDAPALGKEVQKKFIEMVLKGVDFEELSEFVQDKVEGVRALRYDVDDVGVPSTINKPVDAYPNGPMPRGVRHVNQYVDGYEWSVGDDPWLVYVDEIPQGVGTTDVLALPWTAEELPSGYSLDVEEHVQKAVKQPIEAIVEETEYTWSELKTGKNEQSVLGGSGGGGDPDFGETAVEEPDFGDDDSKPEQQTAFDW